ncbi:hypothetical protein CT0861_12760 [Colletotrichum tofieldiae]|uniref:Uncharacterized protein n=1 Tax=Colletotrichum tofieldiae TaxID=708197 RepID=A0A166RTA9_9PEZI|nr:hypothetical protein CT0861_12760 [Colletotrichum tofieldiae]
MFMGREPAMPPKEPTPCALTAGNEPAEQVTAPTQAPAPLICPEPCWMSPPEAGGAAGAAGAAAGAEAAGGGGGGGGAPGGGIFGRTHVVVDELTVEWALVLSAGDILHVIIEASLGWD